MTNSFLSRTASPAQAARWPQWAACSGLLLALIGISPVALAHGDGTAHHAAAATGPAEQTAWGIAAQASQVQRTLNLDMGDNMRFKPDLIEVQEGETLRIVVRNQGRKLHEVVLGTPDELNKHAELMKRFPKMEHDAPWMSHVAAGKQGELLWTFNRPGEFAFACLVGNHFQRGMQGRIVVRPRTANTTTGNKK